MMKPGKLSWMNSFRILMTAVLLCLPLQGAFAASRLTPPNAAAPTPAAFVGSKAELVATVLPTLLERAGYSMTITDTATTAALKNAFKGSEAFLWSKTVIHEKGNVSFTFTLPADTDLIRQGGIVVGVFQKQQLTNVSFVQLAPTAEGFRIDVLSPNGSHKVGMMFGVDKNGRFILDQTALSSLAKAFFPQGISGTFDPLIEALEQVLALLYEIKGVINLAICVVEEMIYMFEDLNLCGWGTTEPGGGAVINLVICSVDAIAAFIEALTGRCL